MKVRISQIKSVHMVGMDDFNARHVSDYCVDHHFDDPALANVKGPRYGKRWACCQDTDEHAPPCKSGYHVTYDCDKSRWTDGIEFAVR